MKIRKDILQKIIDHSGAYLLVNRYVEGMGASRGKDEWHAMFVSIPIERELYEQKVDDLKYSQVEKLAEKEIVTCIHLGKSYPPFQWGIRVKDLIDVEKITCDSNELINRCYQEDIKDYWKAKEIMVELTKKEV